MSTSMMIGLGVLIYVLGLLIIPYVYGRIYPNKYVHEDYYVDIVLWPVGLAVSIVVVPFIFLFYGPRLLVEYIHAKTQEKYQRLAQTRSQINAMNMFDDAPGV